MNVNISMTHNAQDFFNGIEDPELVTRKYSEKFSYTAYLDVLEHVKGGYTAVITKADGDG